MSGATVSDLAPLSISRREVLRNLGYPRSRQPSPQVDRALERLWERAGGLITPRGIHRVVGRALALTTGLPDPSEWVGIAVCTAGAELEREEHRLGQEGQVLEALVLDAFGSAAAEAAADAVNLLLCTEAQRRGYQLPPRISPGYGRWAIQGQPDLLGLLDAGAIGIRLTEGLMMVPRKSVSFAVRFMREPQQGRAASRRCAACTLEGCLYRVEDGPDEQEMESQ